MKIIRAGKMEMHGVWYTYAMKKRLKKLLTVFLASVLLLQSTGCMCAPIIATAATAGYVIANKEDLDEQIKPEATAIPDSSFLPSGSGFPEAGTDAGEVRFSDMEYSRPDTQAVKDAIADLRGKLAGGSISAQDAVDGFKSVLAMYSHIDSEESLAYVLYSLDVTKSDYFDEYTYCLQECNKIDLELTDLAIELIESPLTAEMMRSEYSDSYIQGVYQNKKMNSPEIQDDLALEEEISGQYDTFLTTFAAKDGGRTYTAEEIVAKASEDYEEYTRLIEIYYSQMNEEASKIYLQLLEIRNRIAAKLGYENYAEYMYEAYGRDYSCAEIRKLHEAVKTYIVPVYTNAVIQQYLFSLSETEEKPDLPLSTFYSRLEVILKSHSEEMLETFRYMQRNELLSTDANDKKMESQFTTYLNDYQVPFISTEYQNDIQSAQTIMHELGHATNAYWNSGLWAAWNSLSSLDLSEVDSQGNEMLMMHYYAQLFGGDTKHLKKDQLTDALYSVITGCMEDEFQQEVYRNPGMTSAEMNELYLKLSQEYGIGGLYGYTGKEWVSIPHTFQSPMYYISYATSMIVALQIWQLSEKNFEQARTTYFEILHRPAGSRLRDTAERFGLTDPVSEDTISALAEAVQSAF